MRIQVNIGDEIVSRVDDYATKMGLSRSAFCSSCIGNYILSLDTAIHAAETYIKDHGSDVTPQQLIEAAAEIK